MRRCTTSLFFFFVCFATAVCFEEDTLVPDLIRTAGYPFENHTVVTDDGYIINVFRIPFGANEEDASRNRTPVLIVHGLFGFSFDFLILGPKRALGYVLADNGFDVWLMNCRGTRYSKRHVTLDASQSQYWNYTFHEIGVYDVPAVIDHMINTTGFQQIVHIGHSQGGTTFFLMLAERPEYNDKIKVHISYAPAVSFMHVQNPLLKNLAQIEANGGISRLRHELGDMDLGSFTNALCHNLRTICTDVMDLFSSEMNKYMFMKSKFFDFYPDGVSIKQVIHFLQVLASGTLSPFATDTRSQTPYNISNVKAPIVAFSGYEDQQVNIEDFKEINELLPGGFREMYLLKDWNHLSFLLSPLAKMGVYKKTIDVINEL